MPVPWWVLMFFAGWLPVAASATAPDCAGTVFADADGDGIHDPQETGIADIAVWNGATLRRTDASGRYRLPAGSAAVVTLIKPAGWRAPPRANGLPDYWRAGADRRNCAPDFALVRDPRPAGDLRVLLFADTQTRDEREVGFYGRGIVAAVRAQNAGRPRHDAAPVYVAGTAGDLGLTLGDVTNDAPALYPALNALTTSLGVPWLHAPGNHDVDAAAPADAGSLASFQAVYGPDTYAWEEHEAVFVVLDDVIWQPGESSKYIGGLREDQFDFLAQYLPTVPAEKRVVVAAHMPFFDDKPGTTTFRPADRERLFALFARFASPPLLLTGHGHVMRQHYHDAATGWHGEGPLHEYNVGAACGSYWSGDADADGVPTSTMADGTPKGWAELTVRAAGDYTLRWRVAEAGVDPGTAIALHAPAVLRRGSWPGFAVYANVFMADPGARVEYRIDDGEWRPMQRVDKPDPRLLAINARDDAAVALGDFDRLPEAAPSTHLWRGGLATDLAAGEHRIEVRAFDPLARGVATAATTYRLLTTSP